MENTHFGISGHSADSGPGTQLRESVLELGLKPHSVISWGHTVMLCSVPWFPNTASRWPFYSMLDWMDSFLDPRLTHWLALYRKVRGRGSGRL